MHKRFLGLAILVLSLLSTASSAPPPRPAEIHELGNENQRETEKERAEIHELIDENQRETERELAFLHQFRNFYQGGLKDKAPGTVKTALIKERQAEKMDDRMDSWLESLFVRLTGAEDAGAIREAVKVARRNSRLQASTSTSIPTTMLQSLLQSLPPVTSLPRDVIEATWVKAEQQIERENEELKNALSRYDDVKAMNEALEILLSEGLAADSTWYKQALHNAENKLNHNPAYFTYAHEDNLEARIEMIMTRPFNKRYRLQLLLAEMAKKLGEKKEKLLEHEFKKLDNDEVISKNLVKYFTERTTPRKKELEKMKIQKAILDARKIVTLRNAVRNHKIHALRKLLEDDDDHSKYAYQSLVELAAGRDYLDALKVLLEFTKSPKDFGTALHIAVQRRVDVRREKKSEKILETNTEIITFLLDDKRTTLRKMDKIRKATILFHDEKTLNEWKKWKEQKNKKELQEMKELKLLKKHLELKKLKESKDSVDDEGGILDQCEKLLVSLSFKFR